MPEPTLDPLTYDRESPPDVTHGEELVYERFPGVRTPKPKRAKTVEAMPLAQRVLSLLKAFAPSPLQEGEIRTYLAVDADELRATLHSLAEAGEIESRRYAGTITPKFSLAQHEP